MRHEIDDDERAAWPEDPNHFLQGGPGVGGVVQNQRGERGVDACVFERKLVQVGFDELDIVEAERLGPRAQATISLEMSTATIASANSAKKKGNACRRCPYRYRPPASRAG
jgi:hypothetical protein